MVKSARSVHGIGNWHAGCRYPPPKTPPGPSPGRPCLILGCGGPGRVVLDILINSGEYDVIGFVDSVILNTGCIVNHESRIGTATHICPGARLAGRVTIQSRAFVGIGATIIQNVHVGYEAVVGAGAQRERPLHANRS